MTDKRHRRIRMALSVLGGLCLSALVLWGGYRLWEKPPEAAPQEPPPTAARYRRPESEPIPDEEPEEREKPAERGRGVFTILLVGNDNGRGNTDTMIVGKLDTDKHTMEFVSLPRDTMVNADWTFRKLNAAYSLVRNCGGVGIDGLKEQVKNLTGYYVDCYAVVDLKLFEETVDLLGGVYFDLPMDMDYDDAGQDLSIHLKAGYQRLDGAQSLQVCRFRSGYEDGDLGRVEMQQRFLKAMAEQFVTLGNIPNLPKIVELLADNLETDLDGANIAFLLRQALKCRSEDIRFHTMPTTPFTVRDLSYTFVNLNEWLEMLNACLNPFDTEIRAENLNVVYLTRSGFGATQRLQGAWYFQPDPEETPQETPGEEAGQDSSGETAEETPGETPEAGNTEQPAEPPSEPAQE